MKEITLKYDLSESETKSVAAGFCGCKTQIGSMLWCRRDVLDVKDCKSICCGNPEAYHYYFISVGGFIDDDYC